MNELTHIIASKFSLATQFVDNTLSLIDEGCTIPFISRYRKEKTGGMDEVQVANVYESYSKLKELVKRKETIIKTIEEQGKLSPELRQRINDCWDNTALEDIYLPYKPKRRTRAQVAKEQGLEPLATIIMLQRERDPERIAQRFVKGEVKDVSMALKGAQDIIAETISENETTRNRLRATFKREAIVSSTIIKQKKDTQEAAKYSDYFDFQEPLRRISGNRLLAIRRAEAEKILRVSISIDDNGAIDHIKRQYIKGRGECQTLVAEACEDAYKRLLCPSIENEFATLSKQKADDEAITVFTENLRQLLLAAPLGQKRILGIDPGIRTGCKVVCLVRGAKRNAEKVG